MKLQGLNQQQITEAGRVVLVLIQTYEGNESDLNRSYRQQIVGSLTQILDDIAQTREGIGRPVAQLISEFNRRHNPQAFRYSVANAAHAFELDDAPSSIFHSNELDEAMRVFGEQLPGFSNGWLAIWDNSERRMIGEIYL